MLKKERSKWFPAETITDADYTDDIALLANAPTWAKSLPHSLEQTAGGIGLHENTNKTEYMCFKREAFTTLNGSSLKLIDNFIYLNGSVSSTENDPMCLAKAGIAINSPSIIWKSDLSDKIKLDFFPEVLVSILLYWCTTWTLIKWIEKKLDGNCARKLRAIMNRSWKQQPMKQ